MWPALTVAAGVIFGALFIGIAAWRGMPYWQSIPSTWDAVWHANTIRWILDTGQASSTHMGELRNVETHAALYYPSVFHALGAVLAQLIGAAPTTAYTLSSLAAAVWLFPLSAALLTWQLLAPQHDRSGAPRGPRPPQPRCRRRSPRCPTSSSTPPRCPTWSAYGIAVPAFVLITSSLRHRDRIPLAVLALVGVFSVHITGGVVVVTFVVAWWLLDALWRPVLGRLRDFVTLVAIAAPTLAVLLPQFLGVLQQAEVIAGHAFLTHPGPQTDAVRRDRPAHPPPQRLPDPEHPHRAGGGGLRAAADQADLVAGGGVAAADGVDRAFAERRSAARSGRSSASTATCSTATRAGCRRW